MDIAGSALKTIRHVPYLVTFGCVDMNAIVADLLNNLLPTKIENSSNSKSNVNKQPQDLVLQIDDDSSGSHVIDEGEDPPTQQNIPRR